MVDASSHDCWDFLDGQGWDIEKKKVVRSCKKVVAIIVKYEGLTTDWRNDEKLCEGTLPRL